MLPGIAPTHRRVSIPLIVVVNFEGDKVCPCPYQVPWHLYAELLCSLMPEHWCYLHPQSAHQALDLCIAHACGGV